MKIYTRTGDGGETGLFGGGRTSKAALRVEAYGAVDELGAHLGHAASLVSALHLEAPIARIQADLLTLGADLATPAEHAHVARTDPSRVAWLEEQIDHLDADLPPLRNFILPGGDPAAAALHVARTVCRRAERRTVALAAEETINPTALVYLNRLSDLLFVMARHVNAARGVAEEIWDGGGEPGRPGGREETS